MGRNDRNAGLYDAGLEYPVGNQKYRDLLLDTGTEEIDHMEMLATMINDLLRDVPLDTVEEFANNADAVTAGVLGGMDP